MTLLKRTLSTETRLVAESGPSRFQTEILATDWRQKDGIAFVSSSRDGSGSSSADTLDSATPRIASQLTDASLDTCAAHLRAGELVAFPTETVYGLGANALDASAIRKIYAAKRRPADNPLIVHISDLQMLRDLIPRQAGTGTEDKASASSSIAQFVGGPVYEALIKTFWPGSLTLLFSLQPPSDKSAPSTWRVPPEVSCGQPALAVRMPSHPLARALIARTGLPLAAPSANASGRPSPTTAAHVMRDLGGELDVAAATTAGPQADSAEEGEAAGRGAVAAARGRIRYILDGGPADVGVESTVVDGVSAPGELRVLRPGGVTVEQLAACLRAHSLLLPAAPDAGEADDRSDGSAAEALPGGAEAGAVRLRVYGKDLRRSTEMEANPTTPGMKYRHYSPSVPVVLLAAVAEDTPAARREAVRLRIPSSAPRVADEGSAPALVDLVRGRVAALEPRGRASATARVGVMSLLDSDVFETLLPRSSGAAEVRAWLASGPRAPALGPSFALAEEKTTEPAQDVPSPPIAITIQPFSLGIQAEPQTAAQRLFDGLRILDEGGQTEPCDLILVEALADAGIGLAVMNRLAKAASASVLVRLEKQSP